MPEDQQAESVPHPAARNKNLTQFVGFQLGDQRYAFPIGQIQEIVILDQVTPVPQVSEYVDGVSNLRGNIIPVIGLRVLLGMEPKPIDADSRTIVVNVGARTMGCRVDSVSQVMRIDAESIQPAPDLVVADGAGYVTGFTKVNDDLVVLLDVERLLDPEALERVHAAAIQGQLPHIATASADLSE